MTSTHHLREWLKTHATVRVLAVLILFVICLFEIRGLIGDLRAARMEEDLSTRYSGFTPGPFPGSVEPWMTFGYVNFIFKIPDGYLKEALHITDERYPNIRIGQYAKQHDRTVSDFLSDLDRVIARYSPS